MNNVDESSMIYVRFILHCSPWTLAEDGKEDEDTEGELCNAVTTVLFTIMWRGYELHDKTAWKVS